MDWSGGAELAHSAIMEEKERRDHGPVHTDPGHLKTRKGPRKDSTRGRPRPRTGRVEAGPDQTKASCNKPMFFEARQMVLPPRLRRQRGRRPGLAGDGRRVGDERGGDARKVMQLQMKLAAGRRRDANGRLPHKRTSTVSADAGNGIA